MQPYSMALDALMAQLAADPDAGLTAEDALKRQEKYGPNLLKEPPKKTLLQRFAAQFKDVMILILIAAALISFVIAIYRHDPDEFFEPVLILLIVLLNAVMGVIQESKAEKALDALRKLSALQAKVLRGGTEQIIDAALLVPGDVIRLEAGDFIPADARLLKAASLKAEESALTGESVPSEKDAAALPDENAPLGDRANMIYSGSSVSYGSAAAVVTATGMNTEIGKIAGLLESELETQTPLQEKLAKLGKYLGIIALSACAVVFVLGIIDGIPVMEIFMTAVSLAVSSIPEGLPAIVTIVLAIGVQQMVKKNAIIRRLPAVETLGSASVICSDKTGTLTQNRMTLLQAYRDGACAPEDISRENSGSVRDLLLYASLCCNGSIAESADGIVHLGDPTETAILFAAHQNGLTAECLSEYPRLMELPFDSNRKLMAVVCRTDGTLTVIVKGAFEILSKLCIAGNLEAAEAVSERMSRAALRVLAVAVKTVDRLPDAASSETLETDLTFLGLVGMIDPPRPEALEAVRVCRTAGIKPVMITGDHVGTASAIARELDILRDGDESVTGAELDAMTDAELDSRVRSIAVYARVSPENKLRIVHAWQRCGEVVSMTGDGVNDAPALKAADIGCAMGITGTDVAKGAADMTLTDDNFATIVDAVREGRGIYANIRKVIGFLLGTNTGEILTVFLAMLLWRISPLLPMQLLWVNLVTDSLPAIALGMEPVEQRVMSDRPKPKNESIFANGLGIRIILQGIMIMALTLGAFFIGRSMGGVLAGGQTLAFFVLSMSQVIHSYNMRSELSLFKIGILTNSRQNLAFLFSSALMAIACFTPLSVAFGLIALPPVAYLFGLLLSFVPVPVMELSKALRSLPRK